jgi:hypothetical protein
MTLGGDNMKSASIYYTAMGFILLILLALTIPGQAQDSDETAPFTKEQLAQMLAPIALYPDALLSQVLMASTYPLEVIEADRWVKKNSPLTGDSLDEALQDKEWDPSVKSLCHFPKVLAAMSEKVTETTNLGNAFLAQEDEVMDTIQELREAAYKQGNLSTTPEQKVIVEKETIVIEPANPEIIYVPYYNPLYVYGPWWYPGYPPYYWYPDQVVVGASISFWPSPFIGFAIGSWSYFDWPRHTIIISVHKRPRFYRPGEWHAKPGPWRHAPRHRRGVAYFDNSTARKFGKITRRATEYRRDSRGYPERRGTVRQGSGAVRQGSASRPAIVDRNVRRQSAAPAAEGRRERGSVERRAQPPRIIGQGAQERESIERRPQIRERGERGSVVRRSRTESREGNHVFGGFDNGRQERNFSRRGRSSRERSPATGRNAIQRGFDRGRGRR